MELDIVVREGRGWASPRKTILCIDDDPDTCNMLEVLLSQNGYDVYCATSVADGLALAGRGGFDLILLDWHFPDGTGLELCRRIRLSDARTPIIFCTGESHESERQEALEAGGQAYLVKPIDLDEMLSVIRQFAGPEGRAV